MMMSAAAASSALPSHDHHHPRRIHLRPASSTSIPIATPRPTSQLEGIASTAFLSTSPRPQRASGPCMEDDDTIGSTARITSWIRRHDIEGWVTQGVHPEPLRVDTNVLVNEKGSISPHPPSSRGREPLRPALKSATPSMSGSVVNSDEEDESEASEDGQKLHLRRTMSCPSTPRSVHFADKLERVRRFDKDETPESVSGDASLEEEDDDGDVRDGWRLDDGNTFPRVLDVNITTPDFIPPPLPDVYLYPAMEENGFDRHPMVLVESIRLAPMLGPSAAVAPGYVDILIRVKNVAYEKDVMLRYTLDRWRSRTDVRCEYVDQVMGGIERWKCRVGCLSAGYMVAESEFIGTEELPEEGNGIEDVYHAKVQRRRMGRRRRIEMAFAVRYTVNGQEYWDNNNGKDYRVHVNYLEPVPLFNDLTRERSDTKGGLDGSEDDDDEEHGYDARAKRNRQRWKQFHRSTFPKRVRSLPESGSDRAEVERVKTLLETAMRKQSGEEEDDVAYQEEDGEMDVHTSVSISSSTHRMWQSSPDESLSLQQRKKNDTFPKMKERNHAWYARYDFTSPSTVQSDERQSSNGMSSWEPSGEALKPYLQHMEHLGELQRRKLSSSSSSSSQDEHDVLPTVSNTDIALPSSSPDSPACITPDDVPMTHSPTPISIHHVLDVGKHDAGSPSNVTEREPRKLGRIPWLGFMT